MRPSFWVSFSRSQASAVAATAVDFGFLIFLVESLEVGYVLATALGAMAGAVTNFLLGRFWSFGARGGKMPAQATRYALVSAASLGLNTFGVFLLTEGLRLHFAASRGVVALLVAVCFNFPLHRGFVFRA
jgi:putative flippase GtrA